MEAPRAASPKIGGESVCVNAARACVLGRFGPEFVRSRPHLAEFGPISANLDLVLAEVGPDLGRLGPILAVPLTSGQMLPKPDQFRPSSDQLPPNSAKLGQLGLRFG